MSLEGKVIVVIGASSGIGEGIVRALDEEKPEAIVLAARREEDLRRVATSLNSNSFVQKTDATNSESVRYLLETTQKKYGRIDAVVNSAGIITEETPIENLEIDYIEKVLNTNLKSVVFVAKYLAPIFKEQKYGIYLVISSRAGKIAYSRESIYCGSKAGAEQVIRVLDKEWRDEGKMENVYAFAVGPGFIDTPEARKKFRYISEAEWETKPKPLEFGKTIAEYLENPKAKYHQGGSVHHIDT